jgi:hypothetical protein
MRLEWPLWLASGLVNVPYAAAGCNRTFSSARSANLAQSSAIRRI